MKLYGARDELFALANTILVFWALAACAPPIWSEGPTFLYEVETAAGTSFLLGTTHVGVSFEELPPHVHERLAGVPSVGFETEPSAPLIDAELLELGLIPRYQPILSQRLDPAVFGALVTLLDGRVSEPELKRFKPWLARFALGLMFIDGLPRLETEIESAALAEAKSIYTLETPREQLEVLASIPEDEVLASLSMMVLDPQGARRFLEETFEAYRAADVDFFLKNYLEPADSQEVELLVRARNRRWLEPIRVRFESGPSLLAVGAAHLVGPEGLLALLSDAGLTPLPSGPP